MQVDIKKKYRTRSGLDVTDLRLAHQPPSCCFPIRGIVKKGEELVKTSWTSEGRYGFAGETDLDLIEVVEVSPESTDVSMGKQYQTKNGKKARIYCVDAGGLYPVHGAMWEEAEGGYWRVDRWTKKGNVYRYASHADPNDLIEIKPRIQREVWVNVYRDNTQVVHPTKEKAEDYAERKPNGRIACVKVVIDCEEGEGLD